MQSGSISHLNTQQFFRLKALLSNYYIINWGDNTTNESGFLPSGHYFSMLHSWAESGEYNITVTASDNQSSSSAEMTILIEDNVIADNIAIVLLGILALIALMIALMYSKKDKKKK